MKPNLYKPLLFLSTFLSVTRGQAQPNGPATIVPVNPSKIQPVFPPAEPAEPVYIPRLPVGEGEIMLEGLIQAVSFGRHEMTIQASSFTLPNGKRSEITTRRFKTVRFDNLKSVVAAPYPTDGTPPRWIPAFEMWPTLRVTVVGPDSGSGQPLQASLIELGGPGFFARNSFPATPAPQTSIFFGGVREHVAASGLRVQQRFGIGNINGKTTGERGLALDFVVGRNAVLGDTLAIYFEANAGMENVRSITWKNRTSYPGGRTNWASLPFDYRSKVASRYMDRIHVSYLEQPNVPGPYLTDALLSKTKIPVHSGRRRSRR